MFPFVYSKGANYYNLYEYYNYDYEYDYDNDEMILIFNDKNNDKDNTNLIQQIPLKKIDSRVCSICLEGTLLDSYYNYDIDTITHHCKCKPFIHTECFYQCLTRKKNCVICGTDIDRMLTNTEKCIIYFKIYTIVLLRFSFLSIGILITYNILDCMFISYYKEEL